MSVRTANVVLDYLRELAKPSPTVSDSALLQLFTTKRDESALRTLLQRHGPMVFRVCQRVLSNQADSEDAFQATFLVLCRKAGSLKSHDTVANWLYGVAQRTALKARTLAQRRREREKSNRERNAPQDVLAELSVREAQSILDEELARLPERLRAPLVLCYLEEKPRDEAARLLGWPVQLLKSRLEQAREKLRHRLTRRGLTLSAAMVTLLLSDTLSAAGPPMAWTTTTIQHAQAILTGGTIPPAVASLMKGVLAAMTISKTKIAALSLIACLSLIAMGWGLATMNADACPKLKHRPIAYAAVPKGEPEKPVDELTKNVAEARKKAISFLKEKQKKGHWENQVIGFNGYTGGVTALVLYSLLESGVPADDKVVAAGLKYLRTLQATDTYAVGLQTAALARAGDKADLPLIQQKVDWLVKTAKRNAGQFLGWGYPERLPGADMSNSHYAVLGLHAAALAGAKIDDQVWQDVRDFYRRTQKANCGWSYRTENPLEPDRLTMTCAGVSGLVAAGKHLKEKGDNPALGDGLRRTAETFTVKYAHFPFYSLHGLSRAARLAGITTLRCEGREIDWYRAGCKFLFPEQAADGSWRGENSIDGHPLVATSFALLFLGGKDQEPRTK